MSGHSKWSTIKRQKAATDQKRGQVFTKLATAITLAVRNGGGIDPESNFKLRLAIDKAKAANMPKANIDRAIARGSGKQTSGEQLHEILYEGFGADGVAVLVEVVTDNKNRTQSNLRMTFNKGGGAIAGSGAVSHLFDAVGIIKVNKTHSHDQMLEHALEVNAHDVEENDGYFVYYTDRKDLHTIQNQLAERGLTIIDSSLGYRPHTIVKLDQPGSQKVIKLLEALEALDDVQGVFTNAHYMT